MLRGIVILFVIVRCHADTPTPQAPQVYCGETPNVIYACLDNPKVVSRDVSVKCDKQTSECDRMKCIFRESGWLDGEKVNKQKVAQHFDQFAKDHPAWSPAVNHLKAACLDMDLPAQGVYINCPAYDVMHCVLTSFIRNATPSQWKTSSECQYPHSYAVSCPVCPSSCFAPQVPYGACNACMTLPRTP